MTGKITETVEAVADPYAEFLKALDFIEQTQLTAFTDSPPPEKKQIIEQYHAKIEVAKAQADDASDNASDDAMNEKRLEIMRWILQQTIKKYSDKYANYITPEALIKYKAKRSGKLKGVGLKFRAVTGGYPLVIGALTGGPLDGKDIKPGDTLISVDGKSLSTLTTAQIGQALKGAADSVAKLEVRRKDSIHKVEAKRSAVNLDYTDAMMLDEHIAYIKISRFGATTHVQVEQQLSDLIEQGASGIVLDLRDNPGGSTRAARAVVSMFVTDDHIYCEEDKRGSIKKMPRHGEHKTDLPLAVLINAQSMSCSELVAGAFKSYKRGVIVGSTSYGKGLIQRVFNLAEPLGGAARCTIAAMLRPDNEIIHAKGVSADIPIATDSDFMFKRAGSLNISSEARAFQRTLIERHARKHYPEEAEELIASEDRQLRKAIDQLLLSQ